MAMCWQYLIPIGFVCLMGSALFSILPDKGLWMGLHTLISLMLTAIGCAIVAFLVWRAAYNIRHLKEKIYLKIWV
jgi:hypothetical protein